MAWSLDARIPLILLSPGDDLTAQLAAGKPAAVLAEAPPGPLPASAVAQVSFDPTGPSHAASCTCCAGRSAAADALDRLFQARVRGQCGWFDRVVAVVETAQARAEVEAALAGDALANARFRLA